MAGFDYRDLQHGRPNKRLSAFALSACRIFRSGCTIFDRLSPPESGPHVRREAASVSVQSLNQLADSDEVSTTCVSGWARHSTRQTWVLDPPAHAGGTDLSADPS